MKKSIFILCILLFGCQSNEVQNEPLSDNSKITVTTEEKTNETQDIPMVEVKKEIVYPPNQILFSSERGGDRDLYLMNGDGTNQHVLLDLDSIEGHGDFSPDGNTVVFFSNMAGNRNLYTIEVDQPRSTLMQLTDSTGDDHLPDYSPEGNFIVFESNREGNSEIYLIDSDGSNLQRITDNTYKDKQPKFSPSGDNIIYTRFMSGIQYAVVYNLELKTETLLSTKHVGYVDFYDDTHIAFHGNSNGRIELFVMDLESNEKELLLSDDSKTLWVPVYSQDKKWIAFNKEAGFGTGDIYLLNQETGEEIQLTNDPKSDWGPDFRPLPVEIIVFDSNVDGDRDIYSFNLRTEETINLTNNDFEDGIPYIWQNQIVFFSNRDGDDEIYTMDKDGSNITQLTHNEVQDRAAAFSNDGSYITFTSERDGDKEIFIMNSDGSNQIQLTHNNSKDFWSVFSKDDSYITYTVFNSTQDTYKIDVRDWQNRTDFIPELLLENCSRCEFSDDNQLIAFSTKVNGSWQIAIADLNALTPNVLTTSSHDAWVPTWYDHENLIYSRESGYKASIMLINVLTGEEIELLPKNAQNWRPIRF